MTPEEEMCAVHEVADREMRRHDAAAEREVNTMLRARERAEYHLAQVHRWAGLAFDAGLAALRHRTKRKEEEERDFARDVKRIGYEAADLKRKAG